MFKDKAYQEGMIPRRGAPCPKQYFSVSGTGTLTDPYIYWLQNPPFSEERTKACENIARVEAVIRGYPCAVIRAMNHNTVFRTDAHGRTVKNRLTGKPEVDPADWHITLYLGTSFDNIVLQGHAYVDVDKKKVPTGLTLPENRTLVHEGKERCSSEYYGFKGSLGYDRVNITKTTGPARASENPDLVNKGNWRSGCNMGEPNAPILRLHSESNGEGRVDSQYYRRGNRQTQQRPLHNRNTQTQHRAFSNVPIPSPLAQAPASAAGWGSMEDNGLAPSAKAKGPHGGTGQPQGCMQPQYGGNKSQGGNNHQNGNNTQGANRFALLEDVEEEE
ncbi:hypothetical protein GE09DRAFT_1067158 [Coniochaeta sp. 2T2.1]|nr:hypothetical protein GE09DRAFT_1067158 [Coniochaeta sp. 2T2.1]